MACRPDGAKPLSEPMLEYWIIISENAFENVVWKMAAILSRPQCVKIINHFYFGSGLHDRNAQFLDRTMIFHDFVMNSLILVPHVSTILSIISSGNGLTPVWCQAIIWNNNDWQPSIGTNQWNLKRKYLYFLLTTCIWIYHLQNVNRFI